MDGYCGIFGIGWLTFSGMGVHPSYMTFNRASSSTDPSCTLAAMIHCMIISMHWYSSNGYCNILGKGWLTLRAWEFSAARRTTELALELTPVARIPVPCKNSSQSYEQSRQEYRF